MKKTAFIFLTAATATLGIAACEPEEEPQRSPSIIEDTVPTTDTIPVVDTVPTAPWYSSLVGTRWHCRIDWVVASLHEVADLYWDIINDSTIATMWCSIELNEVPFADTALISRKYSYNPDALEVSLYLPEGGAEIFRLDTVQKTLTKDLPASIISEDGMVYHLIED